MRVGGGFPLNTTVVLDSSPSRYVREGGGGRVNTGVKSEKNIRKNGIINYKFLKTVSNESPLTPILKLENYFPPHFERTSPAYLQQAKTISSIFCHYFKNS